METRWKSWLELKNIKEVEDQGMGWVIHVDVKVTKNDELEGGQLSLEEKAPSVECIHLLFWASRGRKGPGRRSQTLWDSAPLPNMCSELGDQALARAGPHTSPSTLRGCQSQTIQLQALPNRDCMETKSSLAIQVLNSSPQAIQVQTALSPALATFCGKIE